MPFIPLAGAAGESSDSLPRDILDLWTKLAMSTEHGDPFCCAPAWNLAYHRVFHPSLNVYHHTAGGSLILLREYHARNGDIYLTPLEDSWMFGQPLLGPHALDLFADAMNVFHNVYKTQFPEIVLSGVRGDHPSALQLYLAWTKKFDFYRYKSTVQCAASLTGGLDGWLGRRSANHRQKLKKAHRRSRGMGMVFQRLRPRLPEEAHFIYQRMLNVEKRSWKGIEHCGMAESPAREFYGALLPMLALGRSAYVIFAMLDGKDVGFIFGGALGPIYRGQQFSFDQEYQELSIGNLLQLETIEWLCELGFTRYDMGPATGPRMEYKNHWTEQNYEIQTWLMRKK